LIFIKTDLAALSFRVVSSVRAENNIIIKSSQDKVCQFFGMAGSHFFLAFADVAISAMAVNLAKDISNDNDRITCHGSRHYLHPRHRVKNSEILYR
jgi:hypothetical protein